MAGARKTAAGGFDAGDAAERGGNAHASCGIAAETERRTASGDQCRFTTAAAARSAGWVVGIVGAAVNKVVGFEREEQIGQIGFGDGNAHRLAERSTRWHSFRQVRRCAGPMCQRWFSPLLHRWSL